MPNHYGFDEAWSKLTPVQVRAAGKEFVIGYLGEDNAKNLSSTQIADYLTAGVAVLLVYEYSTTAVHGGAARGTANATLACQQAKARNYPAGCAIAFAVDENTSSNPSIVDAYAKAFTAVCHANGYRSMEYGGLATVKRCADLHLTDLHWQTYAWSGNPTVWDSRVAIRQYQNGVTLSGVDVDLDVAVVNDYGAWTPGGNDVNLTDIITTPNGEQKTVAELLSDTWYSVFKGGGTFMPGVGAGINTLVQRSAVPLTDAQVASIANTVATAVAARHDALTDADVPVIEAAVHAELTKVQLTVGA